MTHSTPSSARAGDPTLSTDTFPTLAGQVDWIREKLSQRGHLGVISITLLQCDSVEKPAAWTAYDAITREISAFLARYSREKIRQSDRMVGPSLNGNAFVLFLDPPRDGRNLDLGDLRSVQYRIRRALKHHLASEFPREFSERFGCYVGAAMLTDEPTVRSDRLVYRALDEAFADALRDRDRESRRHAARLRRILRLGLVRSVYQPVFDVVDRRIVGYEALTRVPTGHFERVDLLFRAAQENDSLWNLERLCRRKALEGLPPLGSDQLLFLNIEPDSMHDPDLRDSGFEALLGASGLQPGRVVLEITEHSAVRDFARFRETLLQFRKRGFRLAMDDVGSGYAGLQAIAELAPNYIKVDMTLVRDIHAHPIKRELIATIRRFADSTGITLVAEGVETSDELRTLMEVGVRCAQGFLLSRPGSPPAFPDWAALL